jgi:hypothetical protein
MLTLREASPQARRSGAFGPLAKVKKRHKMDASLASASSSFWQRAAWFLERLFDALEASILRATGLGTADNGPQRRGELRLNLEISNSRFVSRSGWSRDINFEHSLSRRRAVPKFIIPTVSNIL